MARLDDPTAASKLRPLPNLIFMSRWLQLPLYLGLIVAQGVYVFHFWVELVHLVEAALGSQHALETVKQLFRSAVDRLPDRSSVLCDGDWRMAFDARFHHAALVVATAFARVLVAEMHFHSRDVRAESCQCILEREANGCSR